MKKLLLTLLVGLLSLTAFAQAIYKTTYTCSIDGKEYAISTDPQEKYLHIYVMGEYSTDVVSILINTKDIPAFYEGMCKVYDKYLEWDKVAKENNVTDMKKEFGISLPSAILAWESSEYFFDLHLKLEPTFGVLKDGTTLCFMSGKSTSSKNRYITQEYYLVVGGQNFKGFLDAINPENIEAGKSEKQEVDELFK